MAEIVIYDELTNRIKAHLPSAHTNDYEGADFTLINPDLSAVQAVSIEHWLHDNGAVREMTQAEKDALAVEEANAELEAKRQSADRLELSVENVIVALVKRINVRVPSNPITKAEVVTQLKSDAGI